MNSQVKNIVNGAVFLALIGIGIALYLQREPAGPRLELGAAAPDFSLPAVGSGDMISVEQFRGKTVLLDFWATWCPPCREQMPVVQKLADDPELSEALRVISVNADDPGAGRNAKIAQFLATNGYSFTTVLDDGRAMNAYGVSHLPTLVIISPDGTISYIESGVHGEDDLREMIAAAAR
jgi:thiol-disulfide isomerase/thioredoxin